MDILRIFMLTVCTTRFANSALDFPAFEACLANAKIPSGVVINRSNVRYEALNVRWQLKPPHFNPLAFVLVRNELDVVSVVRCAKEANVQVVAKGGGHSFEKFSYGNEWGVVVDLRLLEDFVVDKRNYRATVGAGWLAGPLQWKLWEETKLLITTTSCPTVGISGSATNGGLGLFAGKYGLASDNILEMNVVTADGNLLKVNAKKNQDLYWALLGGGAGSFGIVTKFIFKVHPAPNKVFKGSLSFPAQSFEATFEAWQKYTASSPHNVTGAMGLSKDGSLNLEFFDISGTDTEFLKIAAEFPTPLERTKTSYSFPDFLLFISAEFSGEILKPGTKLDEPKDLASLRRESVVPVYQVRKSYFVNQEVEVKAFSALKEIMSRKPKFVFTWIEQFGGAVSDILPEATAFVHRGKIMYNINASYKTVDAPKELNPEVKAWLAEFALIGETLFRSNSTYNNYVDVELKDYLRRYFGSNLERLVEVKKKYDPENYFSNPHSVPTEI